MSCRATGIVCGLALAVPFVLGPSEPVLGDEWFRSGKLIASDGVDFDHFGYAVALSGDLIVAGAPNASGAVPACGTAYVFARNQGGPDAWGEVTELTAPDAASADGFGLAVAVSGDLVLAGAPFDDSLTGSIHVFARNHGGPDAWGHAARLTADDAALLDGFGWSVAVSGDLAVVGMNSSGAPEVDPVYVFRNLEYPGTWFQEAQLFGSDTESGDGFGLAVAVSGSLVLVGAHREDDFGTNSGAAYIFAETGGGTGNWIEVIKLTASDADVSDHFGASLALSGDIAVVGAERNDDDGTQSGAVYVFHRHQGGIDNWGELKKLTADDAAAGAEFGRSVAVSTDYAVVGSRNDVPGSDSGAAYVFWRWHGGLEGWGQVAKLTAADAAPDDWFGQCVSVSGDLATVGAYDSNDVGAAYLFAYGQVPACTGDADGNGTVNVDDLQAVIADWGTDGSAHGGDVTNPAGGPPDGIVDVNDLQAVVAGWGACPP